MTTTKIDSPNYTQIPNDILGDILRGNIISPGLMAELEGSELKVLLAVCRLTFGFHQDQRRASLTMIQELTGLSRQGVINAANNLEEKGLIARYKDGGVTLWQIIVNNNDIIDDSASQLSRPQIDITKPSTSQLSRLPSQLSRPDSQLSRLPSKKETKKETNKKTISPAFKIFVDISGTYGIKKYWLNKIVSTVGSNPDDLEKWKSVVVAWSGRGYRSTNIEGQFDWFQNGIPSQNGNGANHNGYSAGNKQTNGKTYRTGTDLAAEPYYDPTTNEHVFPDGHREPVGAA